MKIERGALTNMNSENADSGAVSPHLSDRGRMCNAGQSPGVPARRERLGKPSPDARASDNSRLWAYGDIRALALIFFVGTLLGVGITSPYALLTVILDGLRAGIVLVGPVLAGLWLVPVFRLGPMPLRWHLLLGAAAGLGAVSLLVLLLGLAGLLHRPLWIVMQAVFVVAGVIRLRALYDGTQPSNPPEPRAFLPTRRDRDADTRTPSDSTSACAGPAGVAGDVTTHAETSGYMHYLWLLGAPFLCLALLAAANAPGLIWKEEGFAYDVLEYHLQMPKEYFQAGRIAYAPHNVYANFPAAVEMLYLQAMVLLDDDVNIGAVANMIHLALAGLTVFAAWVAGREWSPRAGVVSGVVMATTGWLAYLCGLAYVENGLLFFGITATALLLRIPPRAAGFPGALGRELSTPRAAGFSPRGLAHRQRSLAVTGVITGFACGCKYTALPLIALPLGLAILCMPGRPTRRRITDAAVFAIATLLTFSPWLIKNQVMTGNPVFPIANGVFKASPPGWGPQQTQAWNRGHDISPQEATVSARLSALWWRIPRDPYQRFGPLVILLPLAGLFGRRRDRIDSMLLIILLAQLAVWLLATHLFARFAVVMLIPLTLLCGRAVIGNVRNSNTDPSPERKRRVEEPRAGAWGSDQLPTPGNGRTDDADARIRLRVISAALIIGAVWNFTFAAQLHRDESPGGAPASLIYDGELPGYEYFKVVNHELPPDARILLVGDAKAFYFQRDVDYCVVFNKDPFVETIRSAKDDGDIIAWLRDQGYTHVLVNWSEVNRLSATYGFAPEINVDLFSRLEREGLSLMHEFSHPIGDSRYITLYAVP